MLDRSTAALAFLFKDAVSWWDTVNKSVVWQDRIFHVLAALYGLVAAVALVSLIAFAANPPLCIPKFNVLLLGPSALYFHDSLICFEFCKVNL